MFNLIRLSGSKNEIPKVPYNPNMCHACLGVDRMSQDHQTYINEVSDTGQCGSCGLRTEVCDLDVINIYKAAGISNLDIWHYLPRLRSPDYCESPHNPLYSMNDIKLILKKLLDLNAAGKVSLGGERTHYVDGQPVDQLIRLQ